MKKKTKPKPKRPRSRSRVLWQAELDRPAVKPGTADPCNLQVKLALLTGADVAALVRRYGGDQMFAVHFVEGSMVSLTISPTKGGQD